MKYTSVALSVAFMGGLEAFRLPQLRRSMPLSVSPYRATSHTDIAPLFMTPPDGSDEKDAPTPSEDSAASPPKVEPVPKAMTADPPKPPPNAAMEAQKRLNDAKARAQQTEKLTEAAWSAASGLLLGGILGEVALVQLPDLVDIAGGNALVPPLVTGALLGGAAFAGANSDSPASPIVRNTLGKSLQGLFAALGNAIKDKAKETVDEIAKLPEKVAESAKEKAKETAEEIVKIPGRVSEAAKEKAQETAEDISRIPGKVSEAARERAKETAEEIARIPEKVSEAAKERAQETADELAAIPDKLKEAAKEKAQETADEIARIPEKVSEAAKEKATEIVEEAKATPGRVAESTKRAIEETVEEVVEDVKAIPKKTITQVESAIADVIPMENMPKLPKPPKAPPAPFEESKVAPPKAEAPKPPKPPQEAPKFNLPKVEPPKVEIPKVSLPKVPKPPKAPPKKDDDFVFSEVSLKQFVGQVKGSETKGVDRAEQKKEQERASAARAVEEKRRAADAERKAAAAKAADERLAKSRTAAEAKKRVAEEKRAAAEAAAEAREERRLEAEAKRLEAEEKRAAAQAAKEARVSTAPSLPRPTLSLTSLFGVEQTEEVASTPTAKNLPAAPRGVPTLTSWRQNSDGSITGKISGSRSFDDGDTVTTSPIRGEPGEGALVQTGSGSKYFLATKTSGGLFSLFGGGGAPATPKKTGQAGEAKRQVAIRARQAEESTESAQPRSTFSLSALFGSGSEVEEEEDETPVRPTVQPRKMSAAPRGVPTITSWRQNRDGSISGKILGSKSFTDGEAVTTSPVGGDATGGAVVSTSSGSRYYLEEKAGKSEGGILSLFGGKSSPSGTSAEEARRAKVAEAEARRIKAQVAAEERRQEQEERSRAAQASAESARAAAEQKKQARAAEIEARRIEAERAAEERRREADRKRAEAAATAEAKRKEAEAKRAAAARVKADNSSPLKQRATFSLFGTGQPQVETPARAPVPAKKAAQAPRGVPTITSWRQNRDGSISGRISGSPSFEEGEAVTTSPIVGEATSGSVARTASGSRYFLADPGSQGFSLFGGGSPSSDTGKSAAEKAAEERRRKIEQNKEAALAAAEARRVAAEEKRVAAAAAAQTKRQEAETKKAAAVKARQPAKQTPNFSSSRPTITLFSSGPAPKTAEAPRGVPTIVAWRQRGDGGVTGKIYGSPNFNEGEKVETSPIVSGELENGSVVKTGSGSRYFLSPKKTMKATNKQNALQDLASSKPGSTIRLTKERKESDAKEAKEARKTFSLFGLGGGGDNSSADPAPPPTKKGSPAKTAPRGVPTINRWRKNGDGSVTGFITGSPAFSEGERVTTSPIKTGDTSSGEVVKTGSGSRYFLA